METRNNNNILIYFRTQLELKSLYLEEFSIGGKLNTPAALIRELHIIHLPDSNDPDYR